MVRKKKSYDERAMSPLLGVPARRIIPAPVFRSMYPLSHALGLKLVSVNGYDVEGFDVDEVEKKFGPRRFAALLVALKNVFCCGHRNWPDNHPDPLRRNCEVHCVYACDVEAFLNEQEKPRGED